MKIFQKSLLFASILSIGIGATSIPEITNGNENVQAATKSNSKNMVDNDFYYRISKNRLVKASSVKIITENTEASPNMVNTNMPNKFQLKVTTPNASTYSLKGKKLSYNLKKGTTISFGTQAKFYNSSYYRESKNKMIRITDSTWI